MFASVQLLDGTKSTLTYSIPELLAGRVSRGWRVLVPVGRQYRIGIVLSVDEHLPKEASGFRIRSIKDSLDGRPIFTEDVLDLCQWASMYYFYPLGLVLRSALPEPLRKKPGIYYRPVSDASTPEELKEIFSGKKRKQEISRLALMRRGLSRYRIDRWEKEGLIERVYKIPRQKSRKSTQRTFELCLESESTGDSKFNSAVLPALRKSGGKVSYPKLKELVGSNFHYWLRKWKDRGWIREIEEVDSGFSEFSFVQDIVPVSIDELTVWQERVIREVEEVIGDGVFAPFLLHGVTGSGKTEVYMRLCACALKKGLSVLVLVPEIALITQVEAFFRHRFGDVVAVWHSGLDENFRLEQWTALLEGRKRVLVGARSAVFVPLNRCGLIIVDEEHDGSYKQEDRFRYNARDVALVRAKLLNIPIILGSATPSVQSYFHARVGRYSLLSLPERVRVGKSSVSTGELPEISIVDMRREKKDGIFSATVVKALREVLDRGEQALLFLNRRGYANCLLCPRCGYVVTCKHCDVAMTYHQSRQALLCHYCGASMNVPDVCQRCEKGIMVPIGYGTERVERELKKIFPNASILRMDRDVVSSIRKLVEMLNAVRHGKVDILVGTQMLAKGHDFPDLTLTVVVNADLGFAIPDFRAGEVLAQQLFQVAGRPGRAGQKGRVLVQTWNPGHYIFDALVKEDYRSFCDNELESRRIVGYPPYVRMSRIICTSRDGEIVHRAVYEMAEIISGMQRQSVHVIGPAPAPIFRLRNNFRWHFIVKATTADEMTDYLKAFLNHEVVKKWARKVVVSVDRDPFMCL